MVLHEVFLENGMRIDGAKGEATSKCGRENKKLSLQQTDTVLCLLILASITNLMRKKTAMQHTGTDFMLCTTMISYSCLYYYYKLHAEDGCCNG